MYLKVFVPLTHDGVKGWRFKFVCSGNAMSASHEGLLLHKNSSVNRNLSFDDVCKEKHVKIAYNNDAPFLDVTSTGELVKGPYYNWLRPGNIAQEWELQTGFFDSNNIKPKWFNCNGTWGSLNKTTGQWSGAVGMIQRDEADYAIKLFSGTYGRSQIAAISPTRFSPKFWFTRYPQELSPTWNLFGLFTKEFKSQMNLLSN